VVDGPGIVVAAQREGVPLLQSFALHTHTDNKLHITKSHADFRFPLYSSCPLVTFKERRKSLVFFFNIFQRE
jgi:hypothetical protein